MVGFPSSHVSFGGYIDLMNKDHGTSAMQIYNSCGRLFQEQEGHQNINHWCQEPSTPTT